ncbi:tyrosine-type recombinase/integrase [Photobacterium chitinilyticum]|nr:site-specific integrase [Photobacterium chitinilyticum]
MASGEMYSVLLDDSGLPMLYPNLFVTINHRNESDASNTCYTAFEHLRYLYEICDYLDIDIVQRCIAGDFLSKQEMESLVKWAKRTVKTFREHVAKQKSKNVVSLAPITKKLETARAVMVVDNEGDISPATAYNRLTTFAEYIGWLEEELFPSKDTTAEQLLKYLRPKKFSKEGETENMDENYKSLTPHEVLRVLDVVRPDSSDNPWKNESLRYRNQLIINMLEAIGLRRGELLKVRPSDVKKHPKNGRRYLTIRSKVDLDDTRSDRPEAKTLGRHVPMDKRLSDMYDNYLIHHRSNANGAEFIPYLFVTHNHRTSINQALSTATVNKICREISEVVGFRVHPHAFRHSWNDKFSKHADKRIAEGKVSEAKSESDRQKLMGWHEGSKMAQKYSKRHDDKRAFETGMELQEKGSTLINGIVGAYDEDIDQ